MLTTESRLRHENASDQRGYILDASDPERTPSNGAESSRQQNHPPTFQCHLCPRRCNRAYNLRSHLRTHIDERPFQFACGVCGAGFRRNHDLKRHEGLHAGERTDDKSPPDQNSDSTSYTHSRVPTRHPLQALESRHVSEDRRLADALELERKETSDDRCLLVNAFRIW
jgi:uncharacterized Zn-finger protein